MNEDRSSNDERMVRKIGALLAQSANALEPEQAGALRRARQRAVEHAASRRPGAGRWLPLAAAATVAALAVSVPLLMSPDSRHGGELASGAPGGDFDILLGDESLDMIAELEFYEWLSAEADAG